MLYGEFLLLQVLGAYEDVYMSHSSWFIYQATMRIYKHYDFNVDDVNTAAKRISFSSYAGTYLCYHRLDKQNFWA